MAENPFDHSGIDDVIHGRLRLGIVAYLASVDSASFTELRDKVGATDGNLSAHVGKLEEVGYVGVAKSFVGRKPQTRLNLTRAGRQAWNAWLDRIERLTRAASTNPSGRS
ncbi:MAG TPA: transcriptional regulator [Allosphingosinicella sp.]|jgi:DNA-binding MarR family transcriptional regulator